jgi:hypothetical protein
MDELPGSPPLPAAPKLVRDDPDPLMPFAFTADGLVKPTPEELAAVVAPCARAAAILRVWQIRTKPGRSSPR